MLQLISKQLTLQIVRQGLQYLHEPVHFYQDQNE